MRKGVQKIVLLTLIWAFLSCSDRGANPTSGHVAGTLYQIKGCQRTSLEKSSPGDSCFSYQFAQKLSIDFCVGANCCPDSNRFALSYKIATDTIAVTVADTAGNLCRCECKYVIHAEFSELSGNNYVVLCIYGGAVVYRESVYRKP